MFERGRDQQGLHGSYDGVAEVQEARWAPFRFQHTCRQGTWEAGCMRRANSLADGPPSPTSALGRGLDSTYRVWVPDMRTCIQATVPATARKRRQLTQQYRCVQIVSYAAATQREHSQTAPQQAVCRAAAPHLVHRLLVTRQRG